MSVRTNLRRWRLTLFVGYAIGFSRMLKKTAGIVLTSLTAALLGGLSL